MKTIRELESEISTWQYLSETLTQPHQQSIRAEIITKVENMKAELKERTAIHTACSFNNCNKPIYKIWCCKKHYYMMPSRPM